MSALPAATVERIRELAAELAEGRERIARFRRDLAAAPLGVDSDHAYASLREVERWHALDCLRAAALVEELAELLPTRAA